MSGHKNILLVEDEAVTALLETKMLYKHGYKVVHVNSGERALAILQDDYDVDLILMDIDLGSGIYGTATASEILKKHKIPIVFLTSHTEKEIVEKVKGITRYGYVVKDSGEFVLMEAITMAFELFVAHEQTLTEEKRFETAIKASYDLVYEWDVQTDTLTWYGDIDSFLGYNQGEISDSIESWLDLIHPDDKAQLIDAVAKHRNSTEAIFYKYRVRCRDGSYAHWQDQGYPF